MNGTRRAEIRDITDDYLFEVRDKMDENTTLIMFGDHGVNSQGFHGNNAFLSKQTYFFVYSRAATLRIPANLLKMNGTNIASSIAAIGNTVTPFMNTQLFSP